MEVLQRLLYTKMLPSVSSIWHCRHKFEKNEGELRNPKWRPNMAAISRNLSYTHYDAA